MSKGNRLVFYLDIGNEDGPSFCYKIDNKTQVGKNGTKIVNNGNIVLIDDAFTATLHQIAHVLFHASKWRLFLGQPII